MKDSRAAMGTKDADDAVGCKECKRVVQGMRKMQWVGNVARALRGRKDAKWAAELQKDAVSCKGCKSCKEQKGYRGYKGCKGCKGRNGHRGCNE